MGGRPKFLLALLRSRPLNQPALTPEHQAEAERIYQILRERADADLRQLAELPASRPNRWGKPSFRCEVDPEANA
jgi:hypothetical protein